MYDTAFLTHVKYECFNLIGVMRDKSVRKSVISIVRKNVWNIFLGDKLPVGHSSLPHRQGHFQIDSGCR